MATRNGLALAHEARTRSIIGGFFEVYNHLGFGFREAVHAAALERELIRRGHTVAREVSIRVYYKGEHISWERIDMLVDDCVIVENKSSVHLPADALMQLKSYLGSTWIEVGLLFHYGPKPRFNREYWPNERKTLYGTLSAEADEGHSASPPGS